jgi:hypothetical protein
MQQNITITHSSNVQIGNGNIQGVTLANAELATPTVSSAQYFATYRSLDGRFYDRNQFVKNLSGCRVTWDGYVEGINEYETSFSVTLAAERDTLKWFMVTFPKDLATQLYSLQKNDLVRVSGILDLSSPSSPRLEDANRIDRVG